MPARGRWQMADACCPRPCSPSWTGGWRRSTPPGRRLSRASRAGRQPVHTCYVPGRRRRPRPGRRVGRRRAGRARRARPARPRPRPGLVEEVLPRVRAKLGREPIEDLRVDAEDGYRGAPDAEDDDVRGAAAAVLADRAGPRRRSSGSGPSRWRRPPGGAACAAWTCSSPDWPAPAASVRRHAAQGDRRRAGPGVPAGAGRAGGRPRRPARRWSCRSRRRRRCSGRTARRPLARMVHAAAGRCLGLHYGTYDYSAALGIAAAHQSSDHPAADARQAVMQVAVAGTGARAVDGSTNVLPVGPRQQVHAAWRLHAGLVTPGPANAGSTRAGTCTPPSWSTRYLATYAFFRAALPAAARPPAAYVSRVGRRRARRAGDGPGAGRGGAARAGLRGAGRGRARRPGPGRAGPAPVISRQQALVAAGAP